MLHTLFYHYLKTGHAHCWFGDMKNKNRMRHDCVKEGEGEFGKCGSAVVSTLASDDRGLEFNHRSHYENRSMPNLNIYRTMFFLMGHFCIYPITGESEQ